MIGWIRACHPAPTALVTAVVTALAATVGWTGVPLIGVGVAVLLGQLSVGWSNDAVDAPHDADAGRVSKPTVGGTASPGALMAAAGLAAAAACLLSWAVAGPVGGTCHVIGIAMGWLYNLRLSRTGWAWLPYAVAFGLLPSFVTVGLVGTWPPWWMTASFAIIGVSAHLANSLRDLAADTAIGLSGTAGRLGRTRARLLAWLLLSLGAVVVAAAIYPSDPAAALVAVAAVALLMIASLRLGDSRAFPVILAAAGVLAAAVVIGG